VANFHFLQDVKLYTRIDDILEELRGTRKGKKGSYHALFIKWLLTLDRINWSIKKNTLATNLRLGYLVEQRKRKQIDKALAEAVEVALKLEYLASFKEVTNKDNKPMFHFELNPDLCTRAKKKGFIEVDNGES
jgi:hypothetical protein